MKYLNMFWPTKKTREEKIQHRVERLFLTLTDSSDFEFAELETVQIANELRRKLNESLINKKSEFCSKSVEFQQKGKEIQFALDIME